MTSNINMSPERNSMPTQDARERAHNFNEVALGYSEEAAINEAFRCLNCKNMPCVDGCPVKSVFRNLSPRCVAVISRVHTR